MDFKYINNGDETIIIPRPSNYMDSIELARSDYYRYIGKKASLKQMFRLVSNNHCFGFNFWLRLSAYHGCLYKFCRRKLLKYAKKYGIQILPETLIGYGLYIGHGFGIIVSPTAVIGNNVNLSQFTTIGSNDGQAAIIGDNVYIGPSVCLVENVHIGSNVCIGAGAVVTKDIPSGSTAVGVPAYVIGNNRHTNYVGKRWLMKDIPQMFSKNKIT